MKLQGLIKQKGLRSAAIIATQDGVTKRIANRLNPIAATVVALLGSTEKEKIR